MSLWQKVAPRAPAAPPPKAAAGTRCGSSSSSSSSSREEESDTTAGEDAEEGGTQPAGRPPPPPLPQLSEVREPEDCVRYLEHVAARVCFDAVSAVREIYATKVYAVIVGWLGMTVVSATLLHLTLGVPVQVSVNNKSAVDYEQFQELGKPTLIMKARIATIIIIEFLFWLPMSVCVDLSCGRSRMMFARVTRSTLLAGVRYIPNWSWKNIADTSINLSVWANDGEFLLQRVLVIATLFLSTSLVLQITSASCKQCFKEGGFAHCTLAKLETVPFLGTGYTVTTTLSMVFADYWQSLLFQLAYVAIVTVGVFLFSMSMGSVANRLQRSLTLPPFAAIFCDIACKALSFCISASTFVWAYSWKALSDVVLAEPRSRGVSGRILSAFILTQLFTFPVVGVSALMDLQWGSLCHCCPFSSEQIRKRRQNIATVCGLNIVWAWIDVLVAMYDREGTVWSLWVSAILVVLIIACMELLCLNHGPFAAVEDDAEEFEQMIKETFEQLEAKTRERVNSRASGTSLKKNSFILDGDGSDSDLSSDVDYR